MTKFSEIKEYDKRSLTVEFFMKKYGFSRGKALNFMKSMEELNAYDIGKTTYVEEEDFLNFLNLCRRTGGTQRSFS